MSAVALSESYANCAVMDVEHNFRLYWTIEGSSIAIGMQGTSQGYLAGSVLTLKLSAGTDCPELIVGFSSDGSMDNGGAGADAWAVSHSFPPPALTSNQGVVLQGITN